MGQSINPKTAKKKKKKVSKALCAGLPEGGAVAVESAADASLPVANVDSEKKA